MRYFYSGKRRTADPLRSCALPALLALLSIPWLPCASRALPAQAEIPGQQAQDEANETGERLDSAESGGAADQEEAVTPEEAAEPSSPVIPPGAKIGEVRVVTKGIFDPSEPGENKRVFRFADRLHRTTRAGVVSRQLLFESGDPYSPEVLEESERLLRANRYLHDAEIRPVAVEGDRVDVEVVTRDVWTLRAGISVSRAGGENNTQFSLEDSNLFGTGKDLTVWRIANVDRTSTLLRYRDSHLFGSRTVVEASWADYSDGGARRFELERPFYAFDTRWAGGVKTWVYDRIDSQYEHGQMFNRFTHSREWAEVYGGLSPGKVEGGARRLLTGLTIERSRFDYAPGGDSDSLIPPDRNLVYPWIGFQLVEDGFVAEHGLDRLQRTEDLNLGRQLSARLGWSTESFGADADRLIFEGAFSTGWRPGPRQLLLASAQGGSRWGDDGAENLLVGGRARYYLRGGGTGRGGPGRIFAGEHVFYAAVEADVARRLDAENQLLIGGDTGLRGYPLRFQQGDRRFLFTLEQRFFGEREYFHLMHLGAALFFDAGRAWFDEEGARREELLKDVGIGLRIGSSRSADGAVVHLDLAFPLDGDDSIENVQFLVLTSETF